MDVLDNVGRISVGAMVMSVIWTMLLMAIAFGRRHR